MLLCTQAYPYMKPFNPHLHRSNVDWCFKNLNGSFRVSKSGAICTAANRCLERPP